MPFPDSATPLGTAVRTRRATALSTTASRRYCGTRIRLRKASGFLQSRHRAPLTGARPASSKTPSRSQMAVAELRLPPHSVPAEQAVLGALLLEPKAWPLVSRILDASDFYRPDHRLLYA